jgi:2',3'-cyclic-nucleotide 2'-phosphodiesterase/3'-nucleotidase
MQKLNILYTSDVHGYLLPLDYATNKKTKNGLTLLASAIKKYDKASRILIDAGDSIQGSPLMYFHQLKRNEYDNPVAKLYNHLGYDYFIPGNHDFNYGKKYLKDFVCNLEANTICQNVYIHDHLLFKNGYDIKDFNGFKVLTIGVITKYVPNWESKANIKDYIFTDPVDEVKDIVSKYRKQVNLIVLVYHGGFEKYIDSGQEFVKDTGENQGYRLFHEIDGVDILLTGHQHIYNSFVKDNRVALQIKANASMLGIIEVSLKEDNSFTLKPYVIESEKLKEDKISRSIVKNINEDNQRFLDEIIGFVPKNNLEIKDSFKARRDKHLIVDFINEIQLNATHAMLSATSLGNIVTGFKKEISIRNVLSTYIYSNTLFVIEINGKSLKEYLEKCAEYFIIEDNEIRPNPRFSYPKLEHYNYDMIAGIEYIFDLRKDFGERVVSVKYNNQEILDDDIFTLAVNNYRGSGGGDFTMLKDLKIVKEVPFDVAELMIEYIRTNKFIDISPKNNIKLLK